MVAVFHRYCNRYMIICSIGSFIVNIPLIPLIHYKSGHQIGGYRYLLLAYSLVTMVFSLITTLTEVILSPTPDGWIMFASVNFLPPSVGSWIFVMSCCCYAVQLVVITLSFIYRYFVMCRSSHLKMRWFHTTDRLCFVIFMSVLMIAVWTSLTAFFLRLTERLNVLFAERVYELTGKDIREVSYIGGTAYRDGELALDFIFVLCMRLGITTICICIMLYCVFKILECFRVNAELSSQQGKMREMHRRLFVTLMFQALIPIIFVYLPSISGYCFGFIGFSCPMLTALFSAALPTAQLLDPLMILLFIADYRHSLLLYVKSFFHCRKSSVASISPEEVPNVSRLTVRQSLT